MYGAGGGGCGDGDLLSMLEDEKKSPNIAVIFAMCRNLGIQKDNHRTINNHDAWEYYWELFDTLTATFSREKIYEKYSLGGYLLIDEIDEHFSHLDRLKRKTA